MRPTLEKNGDLMMTDDETDAGLMRLVRKYGDIKKKIVCVHERLHELTGGAEGAAMSLRNMKSGDSLLSG